MNSAVYFRGVDLGLRTLFLAEVCSLLCIFLPPTHLCRLKVSAGVLRKRRAEVTQTLALAQPPFPLSLFVRLSPCGSGFPLPPLPIFILPHLILSMAKFWGNFK